MRIDATGTGLLLCVGLAMVSLCSSAMPALPYAEGGNAVDDPGAALAPELRRYVDAFSGDDTHDGTSPATAWRTLQKVADAKGALEPGVHVLFRRGHTWRGTLDFSGFSGSEQARSVLGAYGPLADGRPVIQGSVVVSESSHVTVRDFDCIKLDASNGAHHILIYDNVVHGCPERDEWPSNGIRVFGPSHHIAIVGNLVYDLSANDCIAIHPNGEKVGVRNAFWVLDNICIGNRGMEDGIDLAMSEPEYGTDTVLGSDVKVVANRVQMKALAGLSAKSGRGSKCLTAGHNGRGLWVVGNLLGGSDHIGVKLGLKKEHMQFSGNVIFNCANNQENVSCELLIPHLDVEHNTILHAAKARPAVRLPGTPLRFNHNLVLSAQSGFFDLTVALDAMDRVELDYNWHGGNVPTFGNMEFSDWRKATGWDAHSSLGPAADVSVPPENPSNDDPRTWRSPEFMRHFIPDAAWAGCAGPETPGAFDCEGTWLGRVLRPLPGLDNNGYGWEGPPIVKQRLAELGISMAN